MQILDEIIDAHGGMDLWNSIDELNVVLSSQGFLFTSLMRWRAPVVKRKQVRLLTREPRLTLFDLPESGLRSELIGNDEVRIVDGNGTTVAQRVNPRATFRGLARLTWDALDFTHFACPSQKFRNSPWRSHTRKRIEDSTTLRLCLSLMNEIRRCTSTKWTRPEYTASSFMTTPCRFFGGN
jgi:hypothetical protein